MHAIVITPSAVLDVEDAYGALYRVATSDDPRVSRSDSTDYRDAEAELRRTLARVTPSRLNRDREYLLRGHLDDCWSNAAGFLVRCLTALGYVVVVQQDEPGAMLTGREQEVIATARRDARAYAGRVFVAEAI